jgi:hypothetical protein
MGDERSMRYMEHKVEGATGRMVTWRVRKVWSVLTIAFENVTITATGLARAWWDDSIETTGLS